MARKPSDDIRDAKRDLKIKGQQFDWLKYNSKGESKGWSTDPTVKKRPDYKSNKDGFRIDWDEKHHLQGLNLYERYTAGMSANQKKIVDERLAQKGMFKGNNGLNRIDLPRRYHESSKFREWGYEGAHQLTGIEGIDSPEELKRIESLSPDERFNELDGFINNQVRHRQVGQQKFMEQFQLQPGNNAETNPFGGNFSQAVLQNRDKSNTAKAGAALREERRILKDINLQGGSVEFNPNGRQVSRSLSKFGKAVPVAGLAIGFGQAGLAAQQGDYASAAAHTAGALVGEVPVVGDVIVESVAGTDLADGTLQSNQDQVNKTLYQEPRNTAAPTGITAFDNVAQPLIKGLAGQPMGLKPNRGSVNYGY